MESRPKKPLVVLVAAGTAGHINAALALGDYFQRKNYQIEYYTGRRYLDQKLFAASPAHFLAIQTIRGKNPFALLGALLASSWALLQVIFLFLRQRPRVVVGAGGYAAGPVAMAAFILRIPIYLIEQNSVAGLTNRYLSRFATKVFTHFQQVKNLHPRAQGRIITTGNPVRSLMATVAFHQHQLLPNWVRILCFGGSLGALEINQLLNEFCQQVKISSMGPEKIWIKHQLGKGHLANRTAPFESNHFRYEGYEYLDNIAEFYQWADLIICRAGASSLSELRYVQKPVLLIPYPQATDNHQYFNALFFQQEEKFPVFVHSVGQLRANNFALLTKIIQSTLPYYHQRGDWPPPQHPDSICEKIYQEVVCDFKN